MDKGKYDGEKKLHILQVHDYYRIPGGEDQVVQNEGELLREHGHQVHLYSRRNEELSKMKFWEKACLPFATVFSLRTFREVRRMIREKKIDIVHVHNTLPLISPSVFYGALTAGVPVVMTVHNFRLLCPNGVFYRNGHVCEECVKKGLGCSIKYRCYRGSRAQTLMCVLSMKVHRMLGTYQKIHYICLTEFQKEKLLQAKLADSEKVSVKPNYVNENGEVVDVSKRKNYVLYAGRLEENKGVKVLLRAYRKLEEGNCLEEDKIPSLVICGEGSLKKQCEGYVRKHHLEKVSLAGGIPNESVRKMMAEAKGVIVPSLLYEGFPMNIAEAYHVKTPVIGSDSGNVGKLIIENVNGWKFETGNPKALAKAIMKCGRESCSFDMPEAEEWAGEGNYAKLMEIYGRCMEDVRKA